MREEREREVEAIAAEIMEHLRKHPRAGDSARGVARWWLNPPYDSAPIEQVEAALELLVSRGVLRRRLKLAKGGVQYFHAPLATQ